MRQWLLATALFISTICFSQGVEAGLFGGISNYQGDLVGGTFVPRFTKPAVGASLAYHFSERFSLRGGATWGSIEGDDRYNSRGKLKERNLRFESKIKELSLVAVYRFFNQENMRWSPYLFGGVALFHFNPYTKDSAGSIVNLRPLSTEGQGLAAYPDRKPYNLTQVSLPFGGGIRYEISSRVGIGLEAGIRKTFTDYLDDVSKSYVDPADLLAARGQQAVDYAYRGDEVPGGNPAQPEKGAQRGSEKQMDVYYFTGLHLTFRLGGGGGIRLGKDKYGCPRVN
jgi:hypothetical protein